MTTPPTPRRRRRRWTYHAGWIAPLLAVLAGYASLHDRGFTSEDFLLIRFLRENPPWEDLVGLLAGPWLGIEVVRFYRPVGVVLLGLEARFFGGGPTAYNVLHLGLHAVNVLLVFDLAVALTRSVRRDPLPAAPVAALLFAVHPLHPNAVAWIASYATLFAATGVLASAVAWEEWRRRGRWPLWGLSLAAWILALGSYEAAVVLPAALLVRELLSRSRRWRSVLPFLGVAGLYLLFRRALFGEMVGGYGAFAERLDWSALGGLARDAVLSLYLLFDPSSPAPGGLQVVGWMVAAAISAPVLGRVLGRWRSGAAGHGGSGGVRDGDWWGYAWAWMVLFLAPFAFQPFVPASGRFAYLAVVGTALALGHLAALAAGRRAEAWPEVGPTPAEDAAEDEASRRPAAVTFATRLAVLVLLAALGVHWSLELRRNVAAMDRAADQAREVSGRLAALEAPAGGGGAPRFVAGHPRFVLDGAGTPLAQVLRYGLADSVRPPFHRRSPAGAPRVYPLPEGGVADHAAAAAALAEAAPGADFVAWDGEANRFGPLPGKGVPSPARLPLLRAPRRGPSTGAGPPAAAFAVPVVPGAARYRLVAVTRGNPAVVELSPGLEEVHGALPLDFLRSMHHLYGDVSWWWVEARGAGGEALAVTPARAWPPLEP